MAGELWQRCSRPLHRIVDIDKTMRDTESRSKMLAQRTHTKALRRVMPGRNISDARLKREMRVVFGHLTTDICINTQGDGLLKKTLCSASTPRNPSHHLALPSQQQGLATAGLRQPTGQFRHRYSRQAAQHAEILLTEAPVHGNAQRFGKHDVVAYFRVRVQWQVIRQQIDLMGEQGPDAPPANTRDSAIFTTPEIAVMDKQGIGTRLCGDIQHSLRGRHTGEQSPDLLPTFHLKAIWAIIPKLGNPKIISQIRFKC